MEQVAAIGRIPPDLHWTVAQFLQTPTAELIKTLKFATRKISRYDESYRMSVDAPPGVTWVPKVVRLKGVLSRRKKLWQIPDKEVGTLHMTFRPWWYQTLEDMGYLPHWVVEEFRAARSIGEKNNIGEGKCQPCLLPSRA